MYLHIESFALGLCFAPLVASAAWYLVCSKKCDNSKKPSQNNVIVQSQEEASLSVYQSEKKPTTQPAPSVPIDVNVTAILDADQIVKELKQITLSNKQQTAALTSIKKTTDAWYDSALHTNARRPKRV